MIKQLTLWQNSAIIMSSDGRDDHADCADKGFTGYKSNKRAL